MVVTRTVGPSLDGCQLTTEARVPVDVERAREEHAAYCRAVAGLGAEVRTLPAPADGPPGRLRIADQVLVLPDVAIVALGVSAASHRDGAWLAQQLAPIRPVRLLGSGCTLTGRDVLVVDRTLYVGLGGLEIGVGELRRVVEPLGYEVRAVRRYGLAPLAAAATYLGARTLLLNDAWLDTLLFTDFEILRVPPHEPWGAEVARVGDTVLMAAAHQDTRALLDAAGFRTAAIELSELAKVEVGANAMGVVFELAPTGEGFAAAEPMVAEGP